MNMQTATDVFESVSAERIRQQELMCELNGVASRMARLAHDLKVKLDEARDTADSLNPSSFSTLHNAEKAVLALDEARQYWRMVQPC
jgi:hypothetical protein